MRAGEGRTYGDDKGGREFPPLLSGRCSGFARCLPAPTRRRLLGIVRVRRSSWYHSEPSPYQPIFHSTRLAYPSHCGPWSCRHRAIACRRRSCRFHCSAVTTPQIRSDRVPKKNKKLSPFVSLLLRSPYNGTVFKSFSK